MFISTKAVAQHKVLPFGNNEALVINIAKGTYSIRCKNNLIINGTTAAFSSNGKNYQTNYYAKHSLVTSAVTDKLGKGKHYTLISEAADKPTMLQHFYCYPNRDFVVTALEIQGESLSSNYMAPVMVGEADLRAGTKLSTLFVPYDNDTFIRYSSIKLSDKDNTSAEVGVVYDSVSRKGLIIGSLEHDVWKSGVTTAGTTGKITKLQAWAGYSDVKVTRDSMSHGYLSGNSIVSPKMFIGYFNDWRDGLEAYGKAGSLVEGRYIKPWTKATPVGWNSWGVIAEHLTYDKAAGVVDFFDKQLPKFRNEDGKAYIDLDSYWDNMTRGGLNGDVSELKDFVAYCHSKNLEPGVYWAPFTDWGYKSTDKNRKAEGGDYKFADMWTKTAKGYHNLDGARALDPTHPGTKQRIAFVIGKLKECGFKMIKIDFLGHGAAESTKFYDPKITTGMQAYRIGMEAITDALDNQMLVYAAISPSLATAKYAHMRRIACDSWKSIKDTHYTLNAVTYGWWQTYLYDYIDADHLVFEKETLGANKARLVSGLISGPVILGDDYSKSADWQAQVAKWLQLPEVKTLIKSGKAFKPVDGNAGDGTAQAFIRKDATCWYLAVFNYQKKAADLQLDLKRLGLNPTGNYHAVEILDGKQAILSKQFNASFTAEGAYLFKITAKK
ncbi:alpha-amylase family protein [Mucilaginibacter myungsuensis]|nr:alpha-galactosidase [Mucilaginibacter myungsuensis]MDN3598050.1 alpha-galactosidase [Mucilaginibacter myungsuensis]